MPPHRRRRPHRPPSLLARATNTRSARRRWPRRRRGRHPTAGRRTWTPSCRTLVRTPAVPVPRRRCRGRTIQETVVRRRAAAASGHAATAADRPGRRLAVRGRHRHSTVTPFPVGTEQKTLFLC